MNYNAMRKIIEEHTKMQPLTLEEFKVCDMFVNADRQPTDIETYQDLFFSSLSLVRREKILNNQL